MEHSQRLQQFLQRAAVHELGEGVQLAGVDTHLHSQVLPTVVQHKILSKLPLQV